MGLDDVTYCTGKMEYRSRHVTEPESVLEGYLQEGARILQEAGAGEAMEPPELSPEFEHLRWFPLPCEVVDELHGEVKPPPASGVLHLG